MQKKNHSNVDVSQKIRKTIGKTNYDISIPFSKNSTENVHDKLRRIIINDCMNGKENQWKWIQKMNSIRYRAEEIVKNEIVYI